MNASPIRQLDPAKFRDPARTLDGQRRASVALQQLGTLWFNTGTLCNLTCRHCYIESSPRNDRLAYLAADDVARFLDEIVTLGLPTRTIGFTGGEPFLNKEIIRMLELALARGFDVLVLTNAMKPMRRHRDALSRLHAEFGPKLALRVSLDHYTSPVHEAERGARSWTPTLEGLRWLDAGGFQPSLAGRNFLGEPEADLRDGYARLFAAENLHIDAYDPAALVLFPEMDPDADVPEITEACWGILGRNPSALMCSSARMVVRRKGAVSPAVLACTLLPYDQAFELGGSLAEASRPISLNHPFCAQFCVLGGSSCSTG